MMRKRKRYSVTDAVELYKTIRPEFEWESDIFDKDDQRTRVAKWVCSTRLEEAEKVLVYLYAELGSVRDLAAMLQVARSTLSDELTRIKKKIRAEVEAALGKDYDT